MSASKLARLELLGSGSDPALMTLAFRRAFAFGDREPERKRLPHVVGYISSGGGLPSAQIPMLQAGIRLGVHLRPILEDKITSKLGAIVTHVEGFMRAAEQAKAAGIPIINSLYVQECIDRNNRAGIETNAINLWWVLLDLALEISPS